MSGSGERGGGDCEQNGQREVAKPGASGHRKLHFSITQAIAYALAEETLGKELKFRQLHSRNDEESSRPCPAGCCDFLTEEHVGVANRVRLRIHREIGCLHEPDEL